MPVDEFLNHFRGIGELIRMEDGQATAEQQLARRDALKRRMESHYANGRR